MYLVLRPPWGQRVATVASEGPPVVTVPADAGVTRPIKKKRRPRPVNQSATQPESEVDEPEPPPLTAADRALEWRGDDVTLPPRTVDMAEGREARPLEDAEINATLASQASGVKDCAAQAATGTDLRSTISVKFVVDGRGRVTRSRLEAPHYMLEHGLLGCTQRALARMRFPATGAPTLVSIPVELR